MSKTAEELITKLDEYARDVDHEYLGLPTYREHQPAMELMVNNYAEQRAVEFAEWKEEKHYVWSKVVKGWVIDHDYTLSGPKPIMTTTELYQFYLNQQNQK